MTSDVPEGISNGDPNGKKKEEQTSLSFPDFDLNEIIKETGIDKEQAKSFVMLLQKQSTFAGPLPPPGFLRQYDAIVPGAAKMIIGDFHEQGEHRRKLEAETISSNNDQSSRGQIFAFIIGMTGLVGAVICGLMDKQVVASVIGGGTLVSLVIAFLRGKNQQVKDLEEKS